MVLKTLLKGVFSLALHKSIPRQMTERIQFIDEPNSSDKTIIGRTFVSFMMRVTVKSTFSVDGCPTVASYRLAVSSESTLLELKCEVLKQFEWESVLQPKDITLSLNKRVLTPVSASVCRALS